VVQNTADEVSLTTRSWCSPDRIPTGTLPVRRNLTEFQPGTHHRHRHHHNHHHPRSRRKCVATRTLTGCGGEDKKFPVLQPTKPWSQGLQPSHYTD
jgi:hypothetical protein